MAVIPFGTTFSDIAIGDSGQTVPGGTFTSIDGITTGSLNISHDESETTNNGDLGYTSRILTNTTVEASMEMVYYPTDAGQALLRGVGAEGGGANFKAVRAWRIRPLGAGTVEEFSFEGYITSYEMNPGENGGHATLSISVKATGALTFDADQA